MVVGEPAEHVILESEAASLAGVAEEEPGTAVVSGERGDLVVEVAVDIAVKDGTPLEVVELLGDGQSGGDEGVVAPVATVAESSGIASVCLVGS